MLLISILAGLLLNPAGPGPLRYVLELSTEPALTLYVHLLLAGDGDGVTNLRCAENWGGPAGGADIQEMTARTAAGDEVAVKRLAANAFELRHPPSADLEVTYFLPANHHQMQDHPLEHRRPILNERLFRGGGELFLLTPEHFPDEEECAVRLQFEGFEERGWKVACSFGVGGKPLDLTLRPAALRQSVFLAGEIEILQREVMGEPLYVALEDRSWRFRAEEFADCVAGIVESERAFFVDFDQPFYLVTLLPVGEEGSGSRSLGGSGLTQSFALELSPGLTLAEGTEDRRDILKLLAHEMFHAWNGLLLQRENPTVLTAWFSEGFTDFYARRLLRRGGWLSERDALVLLNDALRRFYTSPVWQEPNESIWTRYWQDQEIQDLAYHRGDVVAMLVDHAIRKQSGGERSLDDLMRLLVERGRDGWKVSNAGLLQEIERWTDAEFAESLRRIVVEGEVPELPADLFGAEMELIHEEIGTYDLGFDERSLQTREVCGVQAGSSAHQAGLRDGQSLLTWSFRSGDTATPVELSIEEQGARRRVRYQPLGELRRVPQAHPR